MIEHANTADLTATDQKPDGYFYVAWILWTTFCIPIGYFIVIVLMLIVASIIGDTIYVNGVQHITEDYLGIYFLVPVIGLLTGAVQYGLLRRLLPRMGGWVLATAGGWLLGMLLVGAFLRLHWIVMAEMGLTFSLMGIAIGLAQWLVLRCRLPGAGWWPVACLLGWGLAALVNPGDSIGPYGLLVLGFFPACATAAALALLTKQTPQSG